MAQVAVIGAGMSGITISRLLQERFTVDTFEMAEKPGGLIKCDRINGHLFHKVGGHVFNAKNKEVNEWFWNQFDQEKEFLKAKRHARILMNDRLIGYPIENYLFEFDKNVISAILNDLLRIAASGSETFSDFESFLKGNFGETLYHLYFKPYNEKIWNTDLSQVALQWLEGKLPMPNLKEILLSNIVKEEEGQMVHSTFFYPKQGGSQFLADRLSQGLNLHTSTSIQSISLKEKLLLNDAIPFEKIVYTGDVRKLGHMIRTTDHALSNALQAVQELRSNGTSNMLCECDANDLSWLYIPENFTKAHRIIYTGNFSPSNNANSHRSTCVVEFSGKADIELMKKEIGLLPGNLSPVAHNYEQNSYVVQDHTTRERIQHLKNLLEPYGIYLLGRFAEWEYYNMDKAIEMALLLNKRI